MQGLGPEETPERGPISAVSKVKSLEQPRVFIEPIDG